MSQKLPWVEKNCNHLSDVPKEKKWPKPGFGVLPCKKKSDFQNRKCRFSFKRPRGFRIIIRRKKSPCITTALKLSVAVGLEDL